MVVVALVSEMVLVVNLGAVVVVVAATAAAATTN
jgi:hypothetical protein